MASKLWAGTITVALTPLRLAMMRLAIPSVVKSCR